MNNNESNPKGTIICGSCSYDANPLGAKHCQKCGKLLVITSVPKGDEIARSTLFVGGVSVLGIVLLFFGVGVYFFWQQANYPIIFSNQNISSDNTSPDNTSTDIRLYSSMKEVPNVPEGIFKYNGALWLASLTAQGTYKAINRAYPKFDLRYTEPIDNEPGTTPGIAMLLEGKVSFALASRSIEHTEYTKAGERGFKLQPVAVALDAVGCFTHPDISIPGLSIHQLQAIYQGKISNWKEVGGLDLPIRSFSIKPKTGTLTKMLLGSQAGSVSPKVQHSRDYTELFRNVALTKGAIGIGTAALITNQRTVRPVALAAQNSKKYVPLVIDDYRTNAAAFRDGTYPLTRRLFVVIRRDGTPDEQAGVAYTNLLLSKEGQQFIEKSGFVPLFAPK